MQPNHRQRSVDGFISRPTKVERPAPRVQPRAAGLQPLPTPPSPPKSPPHPRSVAHAPITPKAPTVTPKSDPRPDSLLKRMLVGIGKFLLGLGVFAFAFLAQTPAIGQVAIFIYAIAAFIWRISSRTTFILAVMAMGLVLLASVRSDVALASTFAIYAFLLLIVATLTLWREVRSEI